MKFCALVATHHKTGSVWMRTVFKSIAMEIGVPFINLSKKRPLSARRFPRSGIVFSDHSDFAQWTGILDHPRSRILHVIRDPRDVIISAMHYHRKAKETWLHLPRKGLGGLTYQEKLNSLGDDHSRYVFEMERIAKRVIGDMQKWNYGRANSCECKYEDLVVDERMELITKVLTHLGFEDDELESCRRIFWANSLFGDLKRTQSVHIRSGTLRQWPTIFDESLARIFVEKFPDALIQLGYEPDNSWVHSLRRQAFSECRDQDIDHDGPKREDSLASP